MKKTISILLILFLFSTTDSLVFREKLYSSGDTKQGNGVTKPLDPPVKHRKVIDPPNPSSR